VLIFRLPAELLLVGDSALLDPEEGDVFQRKRQIGSDHCTGRQRRVNH
jgi:hypothetical protein